MKRTFTKLMAALALLVGLCIPIGMWGQTRDNYEGTFTRINSADDFVTGYYVITASRSASNSGYALGSTVNGKKRIEGVQISISSNTITDPANNLVYYVTVNENTCTFLNVSTNKYMYQAATTSGQGMGFTTTSTNIAFDSYSSSSPVGFKFVLNGASNNKLMWNNSSKWFANYGSDYNNGQTPVELFKLESSGSSVAAPTFYPASGTYTEEQLVLLDCETDNAVIYYTMGDNPADPTNNSLEYDPDNGIEVSETTTIKAIAYLGEDHSSVATATYTFPITIAAVREQGTGSVFTKGIITYISGANAYIQDATAAICVYKGYNANWNDYAIGVEIAVSGTLDTYSGMLEIKSPTITTVSEDNDLPFILKTIDEINTDNYDEFQCLRVKIENTTVTEINGSNTTISQTVGDATSTIVVHSSSFDVEEGDVITSFYSNVGYYNEALQLVNPTDVQVYQGPSISVDENELAFEYIVGNTAANQSLAITGTNLSEPIAAAVTLGDTYFNISVDENNWYNELSLPAEGDVIVVRLNPGLEHGTYNGTITLTSANASTVTVSLTGTVTNQTYAINLTQPTTGGTIAADKQTAEAGQTVTLTATPATGYAFGTWTVLDGQAQAVTVTSNQFTMPASDVEVEGSFSQIDYTITLAPTTNGTVECESQTAHYGEEVLVTVTPATGYRVQSFTVTETNGQGTVTDIEEASGLYSFDMPAYNVTVTVVFEVIPESYSGGTFMLHTGAIVEGYYIITYTNTNNNSYVMKNVVSSNRLTNGTFPTITNNTISDPEGDLADIVWHIEADGDYWTIYNDAVEKYAAGTDSKNQCALIDEITDLARWTATTSNNTYQFENLGRSQASSDSGNKWLRNNGSNGWACYASGTGGALTLYRLSPYINLEQYTFNFGHESEGGYYNIEYGNLNIQSVDNFEVVYCDEEGNVLTQEQPAMILKAAVVEREGYEGYYLELTTTPNLTGDSRTTYFKVRTNNTTVSVYSDLVTVNQAAAPQPFNLTVSLGENVDAIFVYDDPNGDPLIEEGGESTIQVLSGTTIIVSPVADPGYVISSLIVNNEEVISQLDESGAYTFTMPACIVAITASAVVEPVVITYTLATTIVPGKHYIITNGDDKAMGYDKGNNRAAVDVTIANNVASVTDADEVYEFIIYSEGDDIYSIYDETTPGYLYAAGSGSGKNYLKTQVGLVNDGTWSISIASNGAATVVAQGSNTNKYMRYNGNNTSLFACYGSSTSQSPIYLFQRDSDPIMTYTKTIEGYGTSETDKYYLIASPVVSIAPSASNGLLTDDDVNDYDLYSFDQTVEAEWRNYKQAKFTLVSGMGYLYARSDGGDLTFTGTPYSGDGKVSLVKDDNAQFPGWNLVGNPWGIAATIEDTYDYYVMNADRNNLIAGTTHEIDAMEGIFVIAAENDEELTFTPQTTPNPAPSNSDAMVVMNITRNRGNVIDRAIVRFGEGRQLPKFQLNPNHTKVYFSQGNEDYAVVRSANEGEMPVNFKAETRGTYTLSVNPENVEMSYLHLIDNKTGADVDLLATPSYTFEASNDDYESRFRLVFKANADVEENAATETFAYFNGSEWQISNVGEATLQVVDMMGRVLSSETVSGNANVNINQAAGIYMLRLVNGENVMVQKVVVR